MHGNVGAPKELNKVEMLQIPLLCLRQKKVCSWPESQTVEPPLPEEDLQLTGDCKLWKSPHSHLLNRIRNLGIPLLIFSTMRSRDNWVVKDNKPVIVMSY